MQSPSATRSVLHAAITHPPISGMEAFDQAVQGWRSLMTGETEPHASSAELFWKNALPDAKDMILQVLCGPQGYWDLEKRFALRLSNWIGRYGAPREIGVGVHREGSPTLRFVLGQKRSVSMDLLEGGYFLEHTHPLLPKSAFRQIFPSALGDTSDLVELIDAFSENPDENLIVKRVLHPFGGSLYAYDRERDRIDIYWSEDPERAIARAVVEAELQWVRKCYQDFSKAEDVPVNLHRVPYERILNRRR